jgi:nicotinamidase-related amidase
MTFPSYYQSERVGTLYVPETLKAVDEGHHAQLQPAAADQRRIALLLIDMQVDFIHPEGALSVPGAVADTARVVEWIYRHAGVITTIAASLDSHLPIQIFSPAWWADAEGKHPLPYTVISEADVKNGQWKPLYEAEWSRAYVEKLEEQAKKQLMIWPYHTLIGTPGHNLMPALYEAIAYHSSARSTQPVLLSKGSEPLTEHYSILEPEVKLPSKGAQNFNHDFLTLLANHDEIYIAGQAKSHCVLETVSSMVRYNLPGLVPKMRLLTDAMSSVQHPEINFDAIADEAFERFRQNGLTLTTTQAALA